MKIALVGYGKMGRAVEEIAIPRGHSCTQDLSDGEVCIDFSVGNAVEKTMHLLAPSPIPWVIGTTGWDKEKILPFAKKHQIPLLHAPNFSIGMAIFRRLSKMANTLCGEGFEKRGVETHHTKKKDTPSGSALRLMEEIEGLTFASRREGEVIGVHQVFFENDEESIELTHTAKSRKVFAKGALLAAEWLTGKQGIYTFEDVIQERLCDLVEPSPR